jgi:predicted alpha/beta-fold hydrolase
VRHHFWTIYPRLRHHLAPVPCPPSEPWQTTVEDPDRGPVVVRGRLRRVAGSRAAAVLVHGLGGGDESPYLRSAASACEAVGLTTLRLGLRGSDGGGNDFYHAGLTADLRAAIASPELAGLDAIYLVGFSLGGHVALRLAAEGAPERLRAVAAVCSPLDLQVAVEAFDRPGCWAYRAYVLGRLKEIYASIASRAPVPTPVATIRRVRKLREWDRLTVVPRFGFASPEDYYARASVAPLLRQIALPALLVASPDDPMVPRGSIFGAAEASEGRLQVRWVPGGGHVGFPARVHLGFDGPHGVEAQIAAWLLAASAAAGDVSTYRRHA